MNFFKKLKKTVNMRVEKLRTLMSPDTHLSTVPQSTKDSFYSHPNSQALTIHYSFR